VRPHTPRARAHHQVEAAARPCWWFIVSHLPNMLPNHSIERTASGALRARLQPPLTSNVSRHARICLVVSRVRSEQLGSSRRLQSLWVSGAGYISTDRSGTPGAQSRRAECLCGGRGHEWQGAHVRAGLGRRSVWGISHQVRRISWAAWAWSASYFLQCLGSCADAVTGRTLRQRDG
jgi:hypothetical protein